MLALRTPLALLPLAFAATLLAQELPSFDYEAARQHEVKPHRSSIPMEGVRPGFNQLYLTLIVSPNGDVVSAEPGGRRDAQKYWPQFQGEVSQWKFVPFEKDGKPVTAQVEEIIDLVPPERLPKIHVPAPPVLPDSKVVITLQRTRCFGSCPSYIVTVGTDGIVFDGGFNTVAKGKQTDTVDADSVRALARRFAAADFYSMDPSYRADVTDNPTYTLSISIDGNKASVEDYDGVWDGMPAVITDLENLVDEFARTSRWIKGSDGAPAPRN